MADVTDSYYAGPGFIGYGAQLLVGQDDGSPETFSAVIGVRSIKPGRIETPAIPKTHLRSPDRHHEKLAGISDSGPFVVSGQWAPTHGSQSRASNLVADGFPAGGLLELKRTCAERNFKILVPDGSPATEWPFVGFVSAFEPGEINNEGVAEFQAEITPLRSYMSGLP